MLVLFLIGVLSVHLLRRLLAMQPEQVMVLGLKFFMFWECMKVVGMIEDS